MIALSMLLAVLFWAMVSFFIARAISWQLKGQWPQRIALLALFVLFMVAPIADELLGKQQFETLCREVEREGVKYYGKIELGPEFYFEDGTPKWVARNGTLAERNRADEFVEVVLAHVVRVEDAPIEDVGRAMPIRRFLQRYRDAGTGIVLAEVFWYGTHGGTLSRGMEAPFFVKPQCMRGVAEREIYRDITYRKSNEGEKQ